MAYTTRFSYTLQSRTFFTNRSFVQGLETSQLLTRPQRLLYQLQHPFRRAPTGLIPRARMSIRMHDGHTPLLILLDLNPWAALP